MKRRHLLWWIIAGPFAVLLVVLFFAHPYLAVTAPSGGRVLVVEGWMEQPQLEKAALLALSGRYDSIYTTGTIRPFAYYLKNNEGLDVLLKKPEDGEVRVNVSGTTGAGFTLLAGTDTLLHQEVGPQPTVYAAHPPGPVQQLRLLAWNRAAIDTHTDDIFVQFMRMAGTNVNHLQRSSVFLRPGGGGDPAWPTYAHRARALLIGSGVPEDRVVAVPSWGHPDSRSWANANAFAVLAEHDHIHACDVATSGVHARRSRALFQKACGPDVNVGVIAIEDPACTADNWWRSLVGWVRMLKEIDRIARGPGRGAHALERPTFPAWNTCPVLVRRKIPPYYQGYIATATGHDLFAALDHAAAGIHRYMDALPADRHAYRYAPGKWSVKEVLQHLVDTERIFAYRALRFARNDSTPLPGFDENTYVPEARSDARQLAGILREHDAVRAATIELFRGLDAQGMMRSGIANGKPISVRAIGWTIAGHAMHHLGVLRERYL
ncbi:MAG: DinB family protein [Flavobacteriales bacterium]